MISKRQEADRQFSKMSRIEKVEQTNSKSRSITDADKAMRDLKTANLKKQREAKEAVELGLKNGRHK
jgi:ribosomal protein L15E